MKNFIITIGRQIGSGGKITGEKLAERFSIPFYDKELISIASSESGLQKDFFEKADEQKSFGFLGNIFGVRTESFENANYLSNETLFKIQSDVMKNIAKRESCIIVGRCADYILRDEENLFKIFICANLNDRINRLIAATNHSKKEVLTQIELADKKRADYYNYYSNQTWGDAKNYDLCINSSTLGIEKTVDFIEYVVRTIYY
jgi:cytidylate kinase